MKFFALSDIHGAYQEMLDGLKKAGYEPSNPEHQIISCGDMFGRADITCTECPKIKQYLTSDEHKNKPICIFGNHEEILLNIFRYNYFDYTDIYNGEHRTVASFSGLGERDVLFDCDAIPKAAKELEEWLLSLPFYYETKNHIFVHGFLPLNYHAENCKKAFSIAKYKQIKDRKKWHHAMWCRTPDQICSFIKVFPNGWKKTIVFGHWTAAQLHKLYPDGRNGDCIWESKDFKMIGLDCTTARSRFIEVKVIEDEVL